MKPVPTQCRLALIALAAFALSLSTGSMASAASLPARKACCVKKSCGMSCCKPQTRESLGVPGYRTHETAAGRLAPLDPCECDASPPVTPADKSSSSSPVTSSGSTRNCVDRPVAAPALAQAAAWVLSLDHPPAQLSLELRSTHLRF